jgi:hypothetical protein
MKDHDTVEGDTSGPNEKLAVAARSDSDACEYLGDAFLFLFSILHQRKRIEI